MTIVRLIVPLLLGVHVAASTVWEDAFKEQPLPSKRDLVNNDYFVAALADPSDVSEWHLVEPMPIRDHWLFSTPKGESHKSILQKRDSVAAIYPARVKTLQKRMPLPDRAEKVDPAVIEEEFAIKDPLFESQWHLMNTQEIGNDMNVIEVWRKNVTGKGITVAIIDDGLDSSHPDLKDAFSLEGSWDYNDHQNLPEPKLRDDRHGTRCAGEIAAAHNNVCGVGVAPGARVAGIRILSGELTDADEARAMIHSMDTNSIYSCSWGPSDNGRTVEEPPLIVKRAMLEGIESGRQGKGSIYVFAAGNGFSNGDNCNYDGYTNSIYSITVAATDRTNKHPYYGESCSANMITTYSSNVRDKITTCDRVGDRSFDQACTSDHSGTSAAAPLVAGVFALVLEKRNDLTWRDMQYLCRETAKPFELEEGFEWQETHDGFHYNNYYGFGMLDADALVERAANWELVGPQAWFIGEKKNASVEITEVEPAEFVYTVSQSDWDDANLKHIEHVNVVVTTEYPFRGGIKYSLQSPSGLVSVLAERRVSDTASSPLVDWQFMSVAHWGETGVGDWKLIVEGTSGYNGTLKDVRLKLWGHAKDASKVKRFSDEWDQYEEHIDKGLYMPAGEPHESASSSEVPQPKTSSFSQPPPDVIPGPTNIPAPEPSPDKGAEDSENSDPDSDDGKSDSDNGESSDHKAKHHSIWYYIGVTIVGTGILAAVIVPVGWWYFRRTPRFSIDDSDFALIPSDVELSDINDFAISSDDEENNYNDQSDGDSRLDTDEPGSQRGASENLL